MGTFFCSNCKRELNTKYLHKNGLCIDCAMNPHKYANEQVGTIWDTDIYKQDKFPEIISKINCTDGVGSNIDDILGFGKFIAKKFADGYQFFKHYSMMGQGDVSFWWLFFSVKENSCY